MSAHTPGPWKADKTRVYFAAGAGGLDVPNCPDAVAIARLIAAAPDLLAALDDALMIFHPEPGCEHPAPKWAARAAAAIAKATGEQA